MKIPHISDRLTVEQVHFLEIFSKSCRRSILEMVTNAQSGHPGGSLSCIDYLAVLYAFIVSQHGNKVVVSNGHISPAVYSILAELGYIPKAEVIKNFRKIGSVYEGHVTRHVDGIFYGTGPLGIGASVAAAVAFAEKFKKSNEKVFALMGDGEAQEGQIHEMIYFAGKEKLDNLIMFVDYNKVQLSAGLEEILPINLRAMFEAASWHIIEINGHNYEEIWNALSKAEQLIDRPIVIIGNTIMGKGVEFMEEDGLKHKATWHGSAPKPDQTKLALEELTLTGEEESVLRDFLGVVRYKPTKAEFIPSLTPHKLKLGEPRLYTSEILTDCRTAYGMALLDLAELNEQIVALTADLRSSVMTKFLAEAMPNRHIECGIAEQNMVSMAGGLSLNGFIPFVSTFGAFMTSRAKDQARVNDINLTNVKMVATHCGLSVGEDGPTHQAIDDMSSMLGLFNTMVIEPCDPNHTDRIIRFVASHYGNFYVRMGRHKFPIITKEDGSPYYGKDYVYEYGKADIVREGSDITIAASGAMVHEALKAWESLRKQGISVEIVAVSSIKEFDEVIMSSVKKTTKLLTVEDHNIYSGLGSQLLRYLCSEGVVLAKMANLGVKYYEMSGKVNELYENAGISSSHIEKECRKMLE